MGGGIIDDYIYSAHITQVTSSRGLDVTFIVQYNDAIIFDCITSLQQQPIRFPTLHESSSGWSRTGENEIEWEELEIAYGAKPIQ